MSTVILDIVTAMETAIAGTLPGTYAELDYKLNISNNNWKTNRYRYGVIPLGAESSGGITMAITVDQVFEIILTTAYLNKSLSDTDQQNKTFELFEKMNDIFKIVYATKLSLVNRIMNVNSLVWLEPEYFDKDNVIILRGQLNVKYRHFY